MSAATKSTATHIGPDIIRGRFSAAMSAMYRDEVPAYGTLAAGIFHSSLGDSAAQVFLASPNHQRFETDLGAQVMNEFDHYAAIEAASLDACRKALAGIAA